tara:strand:- start:287726 stop:288769 length:1044 start_codon:yes stop_codon:yes gene_type:complete
MKHTSAHRDEFKRIVGTKDPSDEQKNDSPKKSQNEFINNGELSQAQLQRFFYRRQHLMSKGQYHLNYMALMSAVMSEIPQSGDGDSSNVLDLFDRQLIEDFLNDRTVGQRNYGDHERPTNIDVTYSKNDFDDDAQDLLTAIENTEKNTGLSQSYLVDLAFKESSFGTNMVASTSSARGAYQFINDTWLRTFKEHGHEVGLGQYADLIDTSGKYADVINDEFKQKILDLRFDHKVSAHMAARFTQSNQNSLERAFPDRDISNTDLYMAHFLGAGSAIKFIREVENNPEGLAASKFTSAASANKWVFYNSTGSALSFDDVYARFEKDFEGNRPVNLAALEDRDHLKSMT